MNRAIIAAALLAVGVSTASAATLDTVKQRGTLVCGVSTGLPGQFQGARCRLLPRACCRRARRPEQGALCRAHRAEPLYRAAVRRDRCALPQLDTDFPARHHVG